jgi:hypothetical protein
MKRTVFRAAEIDQARRLLGLGELASIVEIKTAYRHMCKQHHPDTVHDAGGSMQEINGAYQLLLNYCEAYRFSFAPDDIESFDPEKWWYDRFGENIRGPAEDDSED